MYKFLFLRQITMVNLSINRNWYLVWIVALLLLTLAKVYEWVYPSFQHDYHHFLKIKLEGELNAHLDKDSKYLRQLKPLLVDGNSLTGFENSEIIKIARQSEIKQVICKEGEIRFWNGKDGFFEALWCTDAFKSDSTSLIKYNGSYFLTLDTQLNNDSQKINCIRQYHINSTQDIKQGFTLTKTRKTQKDLPIFAKSNTKKPLFYLNVDGPFLAPYYGNALILFYLLTLIIFYIPFHRIARDFFNRGNYPWANLILSTGVLVTASMCQWIVHQNDFYHSMLTDKLVHTKFYDYTLFEFTVFSGIFFHLSFFFYKYANIDNTLSVLKFRYGVVLFNYLASIVALIIYCFIFSAVFIHSDFYFDLNNIFSIRVENYILLFDLLIALLAIFLITNKLTLSTASFELPFRHKILIYLLAFLILAGFIYQSNINIGLLTFFLGVSIIIWMQDFFSEEYQKNILWLISWIIVISILNASMIFHFQNQKKRYVKDQMIGQYVECLKIRKDCVPELIQNCTTNQYELYFFEDNFLKYSSSVYKPSIDHVQKVLKKDSIRHVIQGDKDVLYTRSKPNQYLVISNPLESTLKGISLFSYLFTVLILISYLISLIHQRLPFLPEGLQITFQDKPSLKNRIQFYVILGIVISFLIIAITTVFFTRQSEDQIFRENLESKTNNLCNFLETTIRNSNTLDDAKLILSEQIRQSSQMVDFNVNLFNTKGVEEKVYANNQSEQDPIFKLIDPNVFFSYPSFSEDITITESPDDDLNAYRNLFYNNKRIAILQVEAKASQESKSGNRLANLINTLLNIYVFLFLIAASLATLLANSITAPLVNLGNKIRQIRLGKTNEKLEWSGQDEIGELISNYNQMVSQLDESAQLLAKSERDSAWREMAKQVAHEIKNPLTPMKLSIQYLQQHIRSGAEDVKEMAQKVSLTLIEQIDNLTKIATEFSNFAKMPTAENEKIIINEIVSSVHDLFRKREDIDILLSVPIDELFVFADKNQIIRVLNNLINNAIQAIPETKRGHIDIQLDANSKNAIIMVRDNGTGIPEDMQAKVFLPNFTSKSSGTGLGLAMCQQIIESANGRIYFKTIPGVGTSFYIELPLMRSVPNTPEDSNELD